MYREYRSSKKTPLHRGEPGHTLRDTRDARITQTNLTTIPHITIPTHKRTHMHKALYNRAPDPGDPDGRDEPGAEQPTEPAEPTEPRGRLRRDHPRRTPWRTRPCRLPLPERLPAPARKRSAK